MKVLKVFAPLLILSLFAITIAEQPPNVTQVAVPVSSTAVPPVMMNTTVAAVLDTNATTPLVLLKAGSSASGRSGGYIGFATIGIMWVSTQLLTKMKSGTGTMVALGFLAFCASVQSAPADSYIHFREPLEQVEHVFTEIGTGIANAIGNLDDRSFNKELERAMDSLTRCLDSYGVPTLDGGCVPDTNRSLKAQLGDRYNAFMSNFKKNVKSFIQAFRKFSKSRGSGAANRRLDLISISFLGLSIVTGLFVQHF